MNKPFSQACENNKTSILSILKNTFSQTKNVLEVGSSSGQHAVYFAEHLTHLNWQTSDVAENHLGINQWLSDSPSKNLQAPITLDLNEAWPIDSVDGIFTANTLHIVSWPLVERFFTDVNKHLVAGGRLCIYGPFNYQGKFTSASNANFELWLKGRDSNSGIRHFEEIERLANNAGLHLIADHEMPANNRLLEFIKS